MTKERVISNTTKSLSLSRSETNGLGTTYPSPQPITVELHKALFKLKIHRVWPPPWNVKDVSKNTYIPYLTRFTLLQVYFQIPSNVGERGWIPNNDSYFKLTALLMGKKPSRTTIYWSLHGCIPISFFLLIKAQKKTIGSFSGSNFLGYLIPPFGAIYKIGSWPSCCLLKQLEA